MNSTVTRRGILGAALAGLAHAAWAEAPVIALRPVPRPGSVLPPAGAEIAARSGLSGKVAFALADADTGEMIERLSGAEPMPPASVTKTFTALYARDRLGPDYRFTTRLIGSGTLTGGRLTGDLILAGGGDPVLTTDDLAALAADLKAAGVQQVAGRFLVWGGALPYQHEIDPGQLPHLGYNPAVSGLNLNFNRVYFEWAPQGTGGYRVSMDARTDTYRPDVAIARMRVADRDLPVYTYEDAGGADDWTVARTALGDGGSRWLPVRKPALYAGDVFRTMAAAQGIALPAAVEIADLPEGRDLARHDSPPLDVLIADMLEYSTNLTAEVLGLTATQAAGGHPATLADSTDFMRRWARDTLGIHARFGDHSGLGEGTLVSASEMVTALVAAARDGALIRLMKEIALVNDEGEALPAPPAVVRAKTGTLNFVSALAGYLVTPGGRRLAFAIFTADPEQRVQAQASGEEVPPGTRDWGRQARRVQQQLLQGWALRHR